MKLFLCIMAFFPLLSQGMTWKQYETLKRAHVSHERHMPYRLTHGYKTAKSVLLVHGIYTSPLYFKGMARAFYEAGYNVVTVILPGHWEKDFYSVDKIKNEAWSKEVDLGYEFARELGDKVILSGHSLGALLSIEQSLKRPRSEIHSLVMISPALKVWAAVLAACRAGVALSLDGNDFTFSKPNGIHIPYFSPAAGPLIQSLSDRVLTGPIQVPVFLSFTWNDNVVDVPFVKKYYDALDVPKKLHTFGLFSGISHGDIAQSPSDFATYNNQTNPEFDAMMKEALLFVESHD